MHTISDALSGRLGQAVLRLNDTELDNNTNKLNPYYISGFTYGE
jgi:hypothetical protein